MKKTIIMLGALLCGAAQAEEAATSKRARNIRVVCVPQKTAMEGLDTEIRDLDDKTMLQFSYGDKKCYGMFLETGSESVQEIVCGQEASDWYDTVMKQQDTTPTYQFGGTFASTGDVVDKNRFDMKYVSAQNLICGIKSQGKNATINAYLNNLGKVDKSMLLNRFVSYTDASQFVPRTDPSFYMVPTLHPLTSQVLSYTQIKNATMGWLFDGKKDQFGSAEVLKTVTEPALVDTTFSGGWGY